MHNVRLLILLISIASAIFLIIGLIKPWVMLWWEDIQNRKKVLKLYGMVALVFYLIYYGLGFISGV